MPTFEIALDDGRKLHIDADSQEAALAGVQHFLGGTQDTKAPEASGTLAGIKQGFSSAFNSDAETAKDFYGAGPGAKPADPDYVPANITNGSLDPREWNYSQLPQKAAEMAPGIAQDIAAAKVAAMAGQRIGGARGAAIGGLAGGAISAWHRMAGNDAKADAARRTGDLNATPESQDLARAGLTDAAASIAASVLPTRFGASAPTVNSVGRQGVSDAVRKYLTTAGTGGAASGTSDVISQLGNTGNVDPAQAIEATAGGALASGALAAPRGVADTANAVRFREFGGDNQQASAAIANRLQDAAPEGLGNNIGGSKVDARALGTVKSNLRTEIGPAIAAERAAQTQFSVDATNALTRARQGKPITADDVDLIESEAPNSNAAFLTRQIRMAQLLQDKGTYDGSNGAWAGGISGKLDPALRYLPKHLLVSAGGIAVGHHFMGSYSPAVIAGALGLYGGARSVDALSGMRSPAQSFTRTFTDAQQATRLANPQPPAPQVPPRPLTPPSVPNVNPPAPSPWGYAPAPTPPAPQVNATAMNTGVQAALRMYAARQKYTAQAQAAQNAQTMQQAQPLLKQLAASAQPVPQPTLPQQIDPLNLPSDITKPSANVMKGLLLRQKLMEQNAPQPAPEQPPSSPAVPAPAPEVDPTALPKDITAPAKTLMSALAKVQKMKDAATAPEPTKITKANGKVKVDGPSDPYADEPNNFYEPIPADQQYKRGMHIEDIVREELRRHGVRQARQEEYGNAVRDTTSERMQRVEDIAGNAPHADTPHLAELMQQLLHLNSAKAGARAIMSYKGLLSPETYGSLKRSFDNSVLHRVFVKP